MSRLFSEIVEDVKTLPVDEKAVLQSLIEKYLIEERRAEINKNDQASLKELEGDRLVFSSDLNRLREQLSVETGRFEEIGDLMRYMVVVEEGPTSFGAYVPDFPGCIAAGKSRAEVLQLIQESIAFHLEGLKDSGLVAPRPHSSSAFVEV